MANMCEVEIFITINNQSDKETLFKHLEDVISKSNKENKGCFIGSEERYLFDSEVVDYDDYELLINGWVKWGASDNETISFFKYLNDICFIQHLEMKQFESGNGCCEKYIYDYENEDIIKKYYLTQEEVAEVIKEQNEFEFCECEDKCFELLERTEHIKEIKM